MGKLNPNYIIPDPKYGDKARKRYSELCMRIQGDSYHCALGAHLGIAKIIQANDKEYTDQYNRKIVRPGLNEGLQELDDVMVDVSKLEHLIEEFGSAAKSLGSENDTQKLSAATLYCSYARETIERFRALPCFENLRNIPLIKKDVHLDNF